MYADGNGLYLRVDDSGARPWVQRIPVNGKRRNLGLGGWPVISLAEAREAALANLKLARFAGDPLAAKRKEFMPTLAEAAVKVMALKILALVMVLGMACAQAEPPALPELEPAPTRIRPSIIAPTKVVSSPINDERRLSTSGYESWAQVLDVSGTLTKLTVLFDKPKPAQDAWREALDYQAWLLESKGFEARNILPPVEYEAKHALFVEAMTFYEQVGISIQAWVNSGSVAWGQLEAEIIGPMQQGAKAMNRAASADAVSRSQPQRQLKPTIQPVRQSTSLKQMSVAFEGNWTVSKIKPVLERAMKLYGVAITEENRSRAGSTLVALRKEYGPSEMEILGYMIRSHVPGDSISFPDGTAMSTLFLASTGR